jgi:SagB-type dehydrogenase family enzyme
MTHNYRVNNLLRFKWDDAGKIHGYAFVDGVTHTTLSDVELVAVLQRLDGEATRETIRSTIVEALSVSAETAESVVEDLLASDILIDSTHRNFTGASEWFEKNWRRALYFHLGTSNPSFVDDDKRSRETQREVLSTYADDAEPPSLFLDIDSERAIDLPAAEPLPDVPLVDALCERRTVRRYDGESIPLQSLSNLLFHSFEPVRSARERIAEAVSEDPSYHTASTPLLFDVYLFALRCEELPRGTYRYSIPSHALEPIAETGTTDPEELESNVVDSIIGQTSIKGAAVGLYFVARFDRYQWRYRHSRALRTLFMDLTTHSQRFLLVATALGYGTFLTPALRDSYADSLLETDGVSRTPMYFNAVGR